MLAQVKKLAGDDLKGRFGAWWSGRDYVAPVEGEGGEAAQADAPKADAKPEAKPEKKAEEPVAAEAPAEVKAEPVAKEVEAKAEAAPKAAMNADAAEIRIKALETLWGEGRLAPGSFALDTRMLDALLE